MMKEAGVISAGLLALFGFSFLTRRSTSLAEESDPKSKVIDLQEWQRLRRERLGFDPREKPVGTRKELVMLEDIPERGEFTIREYAGADPKARFQIEGPGAPEGRKSFEEVESFFGSVMPFDEETRRDIEAKDLQIKQIASSDERSLAERLGTTVRKARAMINVEKTRGKTLLGKLGEGFEVYRLGEGRYVVEEKNPYKPSVPKTVLRYGSLPELFQGFTDYMDRMKAPPRYREGEHFQPVASRKVIEEEWAERLVRNKEIEASRADAPPPPPWSPEPKVVMRRGKYVVTMYPEARLKNRYVVEGPDAPRWGMEKLEALTWVMRRSPPYDVEVRERIETSSRQIADLATSKEEDLAARLGTTIRNARAAINAAKAQGKTLLGVVGKDPLGLGGDYEIYRLKGGSFVLEQKNPTKPSEPKVMAKSWNLDAIFKEYEKLVSKLPDYKKPV